MNRTLNMYSIFYYNMINIRVLLIIWVLTILKHFGDLDFECHIYVCLYVCVEREREKGNLKKKKEMETWVYIYIYTSRKFVQCTGKAIENEI